MGLEKMIIREATEEDLEQITEIYNWAVRNTTATFDLAPQNVAQRKAWFEQHGSLHPLFVAEASGRILGYASLSVFREKEAYSRTVELSVYISPDFQRNGIGTLLMKKIIELAGELGHHCVVSGITEGNEASVKMHENLGFRLCGCFHEVGFKFGRWQDVLFYELILAPSE